MNRLIAIMLLLLTAPLFAAVPNEITYQGRLREYGQPVSGVRAMVFRIYSAETGPGTVWESSEVSVVVSSGAFSYTLQPNVDWRNRDFWIETTVSGKTLSPREKLTSNPYAFHARTAESLSVPEGQSISFVIGDMQKGGLDSRGEFSCSMSGTHYYMIPKGGIILWSGQIDEIPDGWTLCDGTNGTPDLRDRFIVGAGKTYSVYSQGGIEANNVSHSHGISNDGGHQHVIDVDGAHSHSYSGTVAKQVGFSCKADGNAGHINGMLAGEAHQHAYSGETSAVIAHSHGGATHISGSHAHGGVTQVAGSTILENRPPYFALAYIMRE